MSDRPGRVGVGIGRSGRAAAWLAGTWALLFALPPSATLAQEPDLSLGPVVRYVGFTEEVDAAWFGGVRGLLGLPFGRVYLEAAHARTDHRPECPAGRCSLVAGAAGHTDVGVGLELGGGPGGERGLGRFLGVGAVVTRRSVDPEAGGTAPDPELRAGIQLRPGLVWRSGGRVRAWVEATAGALVRACPPQHVPWICTDQRLGIGAGVTVRLGG